MLFAGDLLPADAACVHFADADDVSELIADDRIDQYWIEPEPSEGALLLAVADVVAAPDWFGENWDALEEVLGDLDETRPQLLVVRGATALWCEVPRDCGRLIETWMTVGRQRTSGFHLVFVW